MKLPHEGYGENIALGLPSGQEGSLPHPHLLVVRTVNIPCGVELTGRGAANISCFAFNPFILDEEFKTP